MNGEAVVQGISGALLVGLAGFLYLHASYFQRFRHALVSHQTRASLAFAYGLLFLFLAGLLGWIGLPGADAREYLAEAWRAVTPVKSLGAVFGAAPVLGLVAGVGSNLLRLARASDRAYLSDKRHPLFTTDLVRRMRLAALGDVASEADDQLLWTMWRAVTQGKLVQVTLKNRKVYVGSPLPLGDPSAAAQWMKLVPIASGFRDSDTLSYIPTTDYRLLFEAMAGTGQHRDDGPESRSRMRIEAGGMSVEFEPSDLGFILPWAEIASMTIHDPALEAFFAPAIEDETEEDGRPG